jgi:hypothetical protein
VVTTVAQVPEEMALVPSAEVPLAIVPVIVVGKETPFVFVQVIAFDPDVVQSPLISAAVIALAFPRTSPVNVLPVPVPPRAIASVPLEMFEALVVSVVAEAAKADPEVFVQVIANAPDVVQSPEMSPFVTEVGPENFVRFPFAGEPVTVAPLPRLVPQP